VRKSTADELGATLRSLLALRGLSFEDLDASIVSSTVPRLRPEWDEVGERYLDHELLVVGPGLRTGMSIRYDNPREIGPDRLVNAVAGYEKVGGACVIVDFGTAVTHDVVSADGEYLGGVIFPGLEISLEALTERAAALPTIDLTEPRAVLGKSTVDLPISARGGVRSIAGSAAARADSASIEISRPGKITPPRYSPPALTTSWVTAVPKSTITHAPPTRS